MQTHSTLTGARHLAWMTTASLLLLGVARAQTSAPQADPATDTEEVVVLSPFVVDSSKDEGYRATSTLAGSRISTPLKDVAASVTVLTKEFMTDVAAVDINDVLTYTAGAEGTKDFTNSPSVLGRPSDYTTLNSQNSNRIRGLQAADITRDYFYTIGTWTGFDSYNLDQVTINRGPNSVLAGLGSPAGIINYSPQMAGLSRSRHQVTYRLGSYGDQRASFNSSVVAKKDVLGFRVAGVWSDRGYKQQPAWNKDKRLYGAVTYQPWPKTTIRANLEKVKVDSNNPNSLTPEDGVSQWIASGKPSYDSSSTAPVSGFLFRDSNTPTVVFNKDGSISHSYNTNTGYTYNQRNASNLPIWTAYRMNNNKYFQLDEVNLSPSRANLELRTASVSIDQEIVRGLNANFSYINEELENDRLDLFRPEYSTYLVDVNVRNAEGAPNPHYGETYMQYRGLDNKQTDFNSNKVYRGTVSYELDLTKHNKWLGHYRLTGFLEQRETELQHLQYNARSNSGATNNLEVGYRYYLGGSATSPATTVPGHPGLFSGVNNIITSGSTYSKDTLSSYYALKSDARQLVKLGTKALVLQAYLWDDKIVGMFGIRRDKNEAGFSSSVDGGTGIVGPAPTTYGPLTEASAQTKTYGVVVHPLKWLSVHYNHAQNFIPNAGAVDLLGNPTPSPTGLGKDMGFSVRLLEDKLNVKLNWFELTAAAGSAGAATFPLPQWTIPFMELTVMPEIAAKAGITYKKGMANGLFTGDPRLANAYTSDNVSKGMEIELTYNITKNWRVMGSISKQEAKQTNIASSLTAFIEERLAYWKSIPALWQGQTGGSAWGLNQTGEQHWVQFDQFYYLTYKSVDGKPSPQLAKWHASGLTNYTFSEGPLKGFNVGGGVRYIEKAAIGHPAILTGGVVTALDLANPYYSSARIAVDAWVGYKTKVWRDKYDLSFQLNVRDLEQGGGFRPLLANSDGSHASYRIIQPRTFYLTTTLDF